MKRTNEAQLGTTTSVCKEDWQNTQKSIKQSTLTGKPAKAAKSGCKHKAKLHCFNFLGLCLCKETSQLSVYIFEMSALQDFKVMQKNVSIRKVWQKNFLALFALCALLRNKGKQRRNS